MSDLDNLTSHLPDAESARRFLAALTEQHPRDAAKLQKNDGLMSDALTLAAYSPLLSTTLLQTPEYLWWLNRKRRLPAVRTKDELLEALGRFMLTHSQLDRHTQLARFRRRELLRIFLSDIRRLATVAEITEDISNLADAILETALRDARQEMDNRFGQPQAIDDKGRKTAAEFCIVSLGKLGSRELNYSSDIDLLFLFSTDGETAGGGTRGVVTNREYFVKLSEAVVQLVGKQVGEGAAYRVDTRLRPHGRVGPLAISVNDAVRYYSGEARGWERQVLIRSRSSAGDSDVYRTFFERVEPAVFVPNSSDDATQLARSFDDVRTSKQLIDREQGSKPGFNVKLGRGGIREIEFIAQALQLAYGGVDRWLRAPHTLISLSRLADRGLISETELTELFSSYEFLRRLEHVLQMENGLQTHVVPDEPDRRTLVALRMQCAGLNAFNGELTKHVTDAHRVFERIFDSAVGTNEEHDDSPTQPAPPAEINVAFGVTHPVAFGRDRSSYLQELQSAVAEESDFRHRLGVFRRRWSALINDIAAAETDGEFDARSAKRAQTELAEASIEVALDITCRELRNRYRLDVERLPLAVMGLGKLGGGAIDYESDLDLVLVYDQNGVVPDGTTAAEFYSRVAEIFVTTLSSMTRDGSIYRVDLRLRPYGKNGTSTISASTFADYMQNTAAIWEWLAYVKLRGVGGDMELARRVETEIRQIIHSRASAAAPSELAAETRRMRLLLEKERAGRRRSKDVDIKYGAGGMLDIYFAMRFLQLRDNVPDSNDDRTTGTMLDVLRNRGSLTEETHDTMIAGYRFLASLDHHLRVVVGRTTRLPEANTKA
ncbi:MAG TPA: hypothetical protein VJV05_02475, partial [Pyrinomonadaceae bacterium]|nr:hypothetical protein [Pyrinomonadaceae bacterium]